MKWTCIDVRTYNDNNGTKIFGKFYYLITSMIIPDLGFK